MPDLDLLFVYGTLRRGHDHPMAGRLAVGATWLGMATVRGRLYRLEGYPGLVADAAAGAVQGDLFRMHDPAALLALLDAYEECSAEYAEPHEYRRAPVPVDHGGRAVVAWTYLYAWPVDAATLIGDGRFRP